MKITIKNHRKAIKIGIIAFAILCIGAFAIPLSIFLNHLQERRAMLGEFQDRLNAGVSGLELATWSPENGIQSCASLRTDGVLAELANFFSAADDVLPPHQTGIELNVIMTLSFGDNHKLAFTAEIFGDAPEDVYLYGKTWEPKQDGGWRRGGGVPIRIPGAGNLFRDLVSQSDCEES